MCHCAENPRKAVELAPHHIQVNAIAPGWIATEMTAIAREHQDYAEFNKMSYITGTTLTPDGGFTLTV